MQLSCLEKRPAQPALGQRLFFSPVWMRVWRARWLDVVKDLVQWQVYPRPLRFTPDVDVTVAVAAAPDGAILGDDGAETVEA
jgi:hypothetical protein